MQTCHAARVTSVRSILTVGAYISLFMIREQVNGTWLAVTKVRQRGRDDYQSKREYEGKVVQAITCLSPYPQT